TYPAIVAPARTYRSTLETAAHEWTHHYLSFYPLGLSYFGSGDTVTINETVADIVGREIAALVIERFGDPTEVFVDAAPAAVAVPRPDVSVYYDTLRDLRSSVDALLAHGDVDAAEAEM